MGEVLEAAAYGTCLLHFVFREECSGAQSVWRNYGANVKEVASNYIAIHSLEFLTLGIQWQALNT